MGNDDLPFKLAAKGFERQHDNIFHQHIILKGLKRDTVWFLMTDWDWPALRSALQAWPDPSNFDPKGSQRKRLEEFNYRIFSFAPFRHFGNRLIIELRKTTVFEGV